jgi:hypothetical protein
MIDRVRQLCREMVRKINIYPAPPHKPKDVILERTSLLDNTFSRV